MKLPPRKKNPHKVKLEPSRSRWKQLKNKKTQRGASVGKSPAVHSEFCKILQEHERLVVQSVNRQ